MIGAQLRKRAFVVLFSLAIVLRLAWLLTGGQSALQYSDDAKAYHDIAVNLAERHQFATAMDPPHRLDVPYATRPPLTSLALAGVYTVFGPHLIAGQLLLICLSALSAALLSHLGKRLFSDRVGILAGVLAASYPFFIFLASVPLTENIALLLYIVLGLLLTESEHRRGMKHALLTGGVLGLAALDRPQVLGFLPFLALLAFVNAKGQMLKRIRWLGVAVACFAVVVMPWVIRNHAVIGGWFPISLQGGAALYMGNNPYTQTPLDKQWDGARGWYDDPRLGAELNGLSPLDADRKAFHLATEFMREHAGKTLNYSVQKVGLFFSAYRNPVAQLSWYPVLALSLFGFVWTAGRWRQLLPLYFLAFQTILTAAVFTSMPRFRAPVEPFFLLMAAYALHEFWKRWAALRPRG